MRAEKSRSSAFAWPIEARQNPREAVLGDQAAAGKRCAEARRIGSEADIAVQADHQAEADVHSIDRGDDRFMDSGEVGILAAEIRTHAGFRPAGGNFRSLLAPAIVETLFGNRTEQGNVGAGTEPAAGTSENDHPDVVVFFRFGEMAADFALHNGGPGVQLVGPV